MAASRPSVRLDHFTPPFQGGATLSPSALCKRCQQRTLRLSLDESSMVGQQNTRFYVARFSEATKYRAHVELLRRADRHAIAFGNTPQVERSSLLSIYYGDRDFIFTQLPALNRCMSIGPIGNSRT